MLARHYRLAPLAALLLAGCAGTPMPPPPGEGVVYRSESLGLTLAHPSNWPVREAEEAGQRFVIVEASPVERLAITRFPAEAETELQAFAAKVAAQVAEKYPSTRTREATATTVAGRPALKLIVEPDGGRQGVRYVVGGGWLIEFAARTSVADNVGTGFRAVVDSLQLP